MNYPQYQPGAVVNGHVLTAEGQWVPLPPPQSKGDISRLNVLLILALVAMSVLGFLAVQGNNQRQKDLMTDLCESHQFDC